MHPALLLLALAQSPAPNLDVRAEEIDGVQVVTIHAQGCTVREFSLAVSRELGARWQNEAPDTETRVLTAEIRRRPVRLALEWVYGSAGLRGELRGDVLSTSLPSDAREELEQRAMAAYSRALTRFPSAPEADAARMSLIELETARGNPTGALQYALMLAQDGQTVAALSEGRMRAAQLCQQLGRWKEASDHYRALSALDESNAELQVLVREEITRCLVRLEDYERALLVVGSLDNSYPASGAAAREKRALLRGMALSGSGRGAEALAELATVRIELLPEDYRLDGTRALARALESDDRPGEAGKCWMVVARGTQGAERLHAVEQAARLALDDGDELGALLSLSMVPLEERNSSLHALVNMARARLNLPLELRPELPSSDDQRLTELVRLIDAGGAKEALPGLGDLLAEQERLTPATLLATRLARARALALRDGLEAGLAALREARLLAPDEAAQQQCDLAAAALLEKAEQFARAADAYEGRY